MSARDGATGGSAWRAERSDVRVTSFGRWVSRSTRTSWARWTTTQPRSPSYGPSRTVTRVPFVSAADFGAASPMTEPCKLSEGLARREGTVDRVLPRLHGEACVDTMTG